jgi:hypothetical protein
VAKSFLDRLTDAFDRVVIQAADDGRHQVCSSKCGPPADHDKKIPGAKVGDVLYACYDLDSGVHVLVVLDVSEDDYAKIVDVEGDHENCRFRWVRWADNCCFPTSAEALAYAAKSDVEYCGPMMRRARRILDLVERGGDLSAYINGSDAYEEEE